MPVRRTPILVFAVALMASMLAVLGSSAAVPASGAARPAAARVAGQPPLNAPISTGSYFSYPNRGSKYQTVIRNRVLNTINSTWGKYTVPNPDDPANPLVKRGRITMATWSFNDQAVRDALVNAAKRGTTVRVIAAESINRTENYKPWK